MIDLKVTVPYIIETAKKANVRHQVHSFPSGCFMIDIWLDTKFYVIQVSHDSIGLSLITEETGFDTIPDENFTNERDFKVAFLSVLKDHLKRRTIVINGNNFSTLKGFYDEIDNIITAGLSWKTGHTLDAFSDLLQGGFGVYDYEEPIKLVWQNSAKSKRNLNSLLDGKPLYHILVEIIKQHAHIEFLEA